MRAFRNLVLCSILAWTGLARPAHAAKVEEVVVVFKTHFDIGYTDLKDKVIERYRTSMIDEALGLIRDSAAMPADQRFRWTVPGWPLAQLLWPGQTIERREQILGAMRDGRILWHALPFTTHTESLETEDLVRGLGYSSQLSRDMGVALPRDAKMTDVPCHSWVLPTLLKHAGVDFLHIGCNAASSSPRVPLLFWWEGPDASRVMTFYAAEGYGTGLIPPEDWPYKTWLAMVMTGDNHGAPSAKDVLSIIRHAEAELPGVKVRFGRLSDFSDAILNEHAELPVVRGDMPDTWIQGLASMPIETKQARNVRPRIAALESLNTLLRLWGANTDPLGNAVDKAYENSLLYGEHTWGLDGKRPGPYRYGEDWKKAYAKGVYEKSEQAAEDHRGYIRESAGLTNPALAKHLDALVRQVHAEGKRVTVFNPLPWKRAAMITLPRLSAGHVAMKDLETGQMLTADGDDFAVRFLAPDLPGMGYKTFVPVDTSETPSVSWAEIAGNTVRTASFELTVDPERGGVVSLIDRVSGRELVSREPGAALGRYLYERFDRNVVKSYMNAYVKQPNENWAQADFGKQNLPDNPGASAFPRFNPASIRVDAVCAKTVLRAEPQGILPDAITLTITLYRELPYVDIEWAIEKKTPDPWPEGGWLCLPLNIDAPAFRLGRLGSVIDPAKDLVPGSNHHLFCLNSGMTVVGKDGFGVGICPLDAPLVSLGEPGLWKYSPEYAPKTADVYVNLFNNQWSTNFPLWVEGTWSARVRLWSVRGGNDETALITPAWESRVDCPAAWFDGPAGNLAVVQTGLELSRKGVLVPAFGPNPDGTGLVLRFWEQAGLADACTVKLPDALHGYSFQPVDLRGRAAGAAFNAGETFTLPVQAYAPLSYILKP